MPEIDKFASAVVALHGGGGLHWYWWCLILIMHSGLIGNIFDACCIRGVPGAFFFCLRLFASGPQNLSGEKNKYSCAIVHDECIPWCFKYTRKNYPKER